jgi:hypothetical protein
MLETLDLPGVNLLAVLAAAAVLLFVKGVWYLPKVFGDAWSDLVKRDRKPSRRWLWVGLVGHLLLALVLAVVVRLAHAATIVDGLFLGILVWLGFVVTLEINRLVWEKIPFNLFLVRVGDYLIGLALAGAILAVWR